MEIFYSDNIAGDRLCLSAEEAAHCVQVLRHRPGDRIAVIDGKGTLYSCVLLPWAEGSKKKAPGEVFAQIEGEEPHWGAHPYNLTLAVCPTKNIDRFEWMAEKATEVGIDALVPVIGERSERRVLKLDRLQRILLSATKQSLKGAIPVLAEPRSVMEFVASVGATEAAADGSNTLRLIAYCSDEVQPRANIMEELCCYFSKGSELQNGSNSQNGSDMQKNEGQGCKGSNMTKSKEQICNMLSNSSKEQKCNRSNFPKIEVLIGPEGDFSPEEVRAAMAAGFVPVSLGSSRLRTETAALTAAEAVYLSALQYLSSKK